MDSISDHIQKIKNLNKEPAEFLNFPDELKNDPTFLIECLMCTSHVFKYIPDKFKNDKYFCLMTIQNNSNFIRFFSDDLKNDRDIVTACVSMNGNSLQYFSEYYRNDRSIVMVAINQSYQSIQYVSDELKNDENIAYFALFASKKQSKIGLNLDIFSNKFLTDKKFILKLVQIYPTSFSKVSNEFKNDDDIVNLAIFLSVSNLLHASSRFNSSEQFVYPFVKKNVRYFNFASEEFKALYGNAQNFLKSYEMNDNLHDTLNHQPINHSSFKI